MSDVTAQAWVLLGIARDCLPSDNQEMRLWCHDRLTDFLEDYPNALAGERHDQADASDNVSPNE